MIAGDNAENPEVVPENTMPAPVETDQQDQPETTPDKTFTQAELDEVVEKRLARERRKYERERHQREVEEAERRGRESAQAQPQDDAPPKREDFDSLEDWLEAKTDWKVEQKLRERDARADTIERQREAKTRAEQMDRTWQERTREAQKRFADFDEVVTQNEDLTVTPAMAAAIKATDNGIDIAYHLGKNPAEAERIASLDPVAQVWELGKLAATLNTKPVSKAPPPVEPVKAGRSASNDLYDPNLSTEQFIKLRNKQVAG